MRIRLKSFGSQAGGSTLIGLVLGVCTGILMLIKWPELADYIEPHAQQFLATDLESVASSIKQRTNNLADDLPKQIDKSVLREIELRRGSDTISSSVPSKLARSAPLNSVEAAKSHTEIAAVVEIWEAFSTESSAKKFAHAASEDLGVEIDVVERSPDHFVPTVMCSLGTDCSSILSSINAMFSFEQKDV